MKDQLARDSAALGDSDPLRRILAEVCDLTGMGFAAVSRVTDTRWIACQVIDRIEFGLDPGDELDLKTTICDDIRACGKAIVIDFVDADIEWRKHPTPMLYGFQSYASFPIVLEDGRFFGTLCAIDPSPRDLTNDRIVDRMETLAREAGAVLSHAQARLDALS